jgi:hypothetical protein
MRYSTIIEGQEWNADDADFYDIKRSSSINQLWRLS